MTGTRAYVALVTAPDREIATSLAERLVEERLAACANLLPDVTSVFRWQGAMQREQEALLILKTTAERLDALRERVLALHPYDVPEFLAVEIAAGAADYLDWMADCVSAGGDVKA